MLIEWFNSLVSIFVSLFTVDTVDAPVYEKGGEVIETEKVLK